MIKYLLLMLIFTYPIFSMEKPSHDYNFEVTEQEIENWISSLDAVPTIPLSPSLNLEPIINEFPLEQQLTDHSFQDVRNFFESQAPEPENVIVTRVQPRVLTPIEKIIRAIRCTDYRELDETIRSNPSVINEKKSITMCNLLKPPNCKKSERLSQIVTPLIFSCHQKANFIVKKLLEKKADPNESGHKGITPLLVVASSGNYEAAEELLRAGADPRKADESNNTPLEIAIKRNNKNIEALILRHIKNLPISHYIAQREWVDKLFQAITDTDNPYQVHLLTLPDRKKDIDALNLVEAPSIYSDVISLRMLTALHFAAYYRNENAVKILLNAGADPNVMEHHRVTPLHIAAALGDSKIVSVLLQNGALKNLRENVLNLSAAEIAAQRRHYETQKIIVYHPS